MASTLLRLPPLSAVSRVRRNDKLIELENQSMRLTTTTRAAVVLLTAAVPGAPDVLAAAAEAAALREELASTRAAFEARIAALEQRLAQIEGESPRTGTVATERLDLIEARLQQVEIEATQPDPSPTSPSAFNPQMSLILAGTWSNLSEDPEDYVLQGFIPAGEETGPGERGFSLGESELTLSANIDPLFYGQATFAVTAEDEIEVEEAFVRTLALPAGFIAQFGRAYSAVGYQNTQHAHTWDFADTPLVYQSMFGGQYGNDGVQLRWLAPLDTFLEFGAEIGNGRSFPGEDAGNGVGAYTLFAAAGDDIGISASWKAGIAWLSADAEDRGYEEPDVENDGAMNPTAFSGDSDTWSTYVVYKWAPNGNSRERNLKLQGEYFERREDGLLWQENASLGAGEMAYRADSSGWYVQGVYQFMPAWRIGVRYDRLDADDTRLRSRDGVLSAADFPTLAPYDPERTTLMIDYSPTEYSRLRLQYARNENAPGTDGDEIYLQYLMSLGTHGAHQF